MEWPVTAVASAVCATPCAPAQHSTPAQHLPPPPHTHTCQPPPPGQPATRRRLLPQPRPPQHMPPPHTHISRSPPHMSVLVDMGLVRGANPSAALPDLTPSPLITPHTHTHTRTRMSMLPESFFTDSATSDTVQALLPA